MAKKTSYGCVFVTSRLLWLLIVCKGDWLVCCHSPFTVLKLEKVQCKTDLGNICLQSKSYVLSLPTHFKRCNIQGEGSPSPICIILFRVSLFRLSARVCTELASYMQSASNKSNHKVFTAAPQTFLQPVSCQQLPAMLTISSAGDCKMVTNQSRSV